MRISDWSSDVCSSDLRIMAFAGIERRRRRALSFLRRTRNEALEVPDEQLLGHLVMAGAGQHRMAHRRGSSKARAVRAAASRIGRNIRSINVWRIVSRAPCARSEEHTSELQSLMRISYTLFCLEKKSKHR